MGDLCVPTIAFGPIPEQFDNLKHKPYYQAFFIMSPSQSGVQCKQEQEVQ